MSVEVPKGSRTNEDQMSDGSRSFFKDGTQQARINGHFVPLTPRIKQFVVHDINGMPEVRDFTQALILDFIHAHIELRRTLVALGGDAPERTLAFFLKDLADPDGDKFPEQEFYDEMQLHDVTTNATNQEVAIVSHPDFPQIDNEQQLKLWMEVPFDRIRSVNYSMPQNGHDTQDPKF